MPSRDDSSDLSFYRSLLLLAACIYLMWWFLVEGLLPGSFNPLGSRLAVVGTLLGIWAASFPLKLIRSYFQYLYMAGVWALTAHYYYLMHGNAGETNWVIGAFITILATSYCFFSLPSLVAYSAFVAILSVALLVLVPPLQRSVFAPGIVTILLQANISLYARRRVLRRLTESNNRFQLLFHSTAEGVLVHENQRVVHVNESLAWMLGYSRDELVGRQLLELLPPEDQASAARRIQAADARPYLTRGVRKDGSIVDIEVRAKDIQFDGKTLRLVSVTDLAERKRMEAERATNLAMVEKVRYLDEFLSLASHELKTPLTSMKLSAQLMEREVRANTAPSRERLTNATGMIQKQIKRLTMLVDTMLDVSMISAQKPGLLVEDVNLTKLAEEVVARLQPQSEKSGTPITLESPWALMARGDPSRLMQVMENLLTNAMKYGNRRPVKISLLQQSRDVVLEVADQGIGIDPEHLERIFQRFERADSAQNISGLGLGLFLTRQLVTAHGGTVTASSVLGQGSVFIVRMPIAK